MILYTVHKNDLSNAIAAMNLLNKHINYELANAENDYVILYVKYHFSSRLLTNTEIRLLDLYGSWADDGEDKKKKEEDQLEQFVRAMGGVEINCTKD